MLFWAQETFILCPSAGRSYVPGWQRRGYLLRDGLPECRGTLVERPDEGRDVLLCTLGVFCGRDVRTLVLCGAWFTVVRVELGRL